MLEEQGIELGQSSVQQESNGKSDNENSANNSGGSSNLAQQSQEQVNEDPAADISRVIEQGISGGRIGGIDYYA
jgi:flagellar hook-length control protein FliK